MEFSDAAETQVIAGGDVTAAPQPVPSRPFTAAGVATPPPGASAGATGGFSASFFGLAAGADFGPRYRIEGVLGEGGMGKVYKAYDRDLSRMVALKLVRPEYALDPNSMQRLKQELLLASKISHKNVLRIHDMGDVNGVKFMSMAFVDGEDLHDIIEKQGRLPLDRTLEITRQLCGALEAAHKEDVVHRDLKPRNILVDRSGTIYVSDFGLAKSLEADATVMTRTGQILGTPAYMSPEQVKGTNPDHRSDIYSLGLILYEMATGVLPFKAESTLQLMYQQVNERPKNPRTLNPDLPDYVARIIMKCVEKDPARRYQSAREIVHDLDTGRAPGHSLIIEIPKPTRRGWLTVAGIALSLILVIVAITVGRHLHWFSPAKSTTTEKYLAVLPFRAPGDQEALKYEAEGVVEALSAKLFQLKTVHLASPAAVEKIDPKDTLEKTARSLGVKLVVQGTVRGSGDRISVIVSLDDVAARKQLWTEEFSGLRQDLLTIEDQIYDKLVAALKLTPSNEELARGAMRPTEDFEAYELYLKSRNILRGGRKDEKQIAAAIALLNQAIEKDRRFALAYAGLADASLLMYDLKKDNSWATKALGAAQQAQQLNDALPEVHFSLGTVFRLTGRHAEAVAELKRALALAPNSDEAYRRLGSAYLAAGRKGDAIQAIEKAVEVNPYYASNYTVLGLVQLQIGDNDKALDAFRRVTELEPDSASGYSNMGVVYYRQGKWNDCIPAFQKALERQPSFSVYSNLGTAYFYLGHYIDAVRMFEKAVEMNPNQQVAVGNLADAYRAAGQTGKANVTYERAINLAHKAFQVNPRDAATLGSLAMYYAKKGEAGKALDFISRARAIDGNNNSLAYKQAVIHALAGHKAEALQGLREAFQKGYPVREAQNDPELKDLRLDPEVAKLLSGVSQKPN
jgi:tetratricopeptide (TPR) repeat protein